MGENEGTEPGTSSLNEHQVRYIRSTCEHIDRLLTDIEGALNGSTSKSAFPRYSTDFTPLQRQTIENFAAHLRAQLIRILSDLGIARNQPTVPVSRAIRGSLIAIDIAVEELRPKHMRAYGEISGNMTMELEGIAEELHDLLRRLDGDLGETVDDSEGG